MKRIITRIALVPLMAVGLTTSCLLDPQNKKGGDGGGGARYVGAVGYLQV